MEMNELFYQNPYQTSFDADVVSCEEVKGNYHIILSDTCFYPEGGGQPCDLGTLNDAEVIDVRRKGDAVIHVVRKPLSGRVHGEINWERRFDHMQNHTGEHIVSGLIHQAFGYENVGFHMGDVIQIDFNGPLSDKDVHDIEARANRIIWNNQKVKEVFPDHPDEWEYRSKKELSGKIRLIVIDNADVCACCGTHCAYTGEVGIIKILSCVKHKNGVRLEMLAGRRAYEWLDRVQQENTKISILLAAKRHETAAAVERVLEASGQMKKKLNDMTLSLLGERINGFAGKEHVIDFLDDIDRNVLRKYVNDLKEARGGYAAVFFGHDETWNYIIASKTFDARKPLKAFNAAVNGRGGGSAEMVQGSVNASSAAIRAAFEREFLAGEQA